MPLLPTERYTSRALWFPASRSISLLTEREEVNTSLKAVESVTTAKEDIRLSIKNPDIAWLLPTSAAERCAGFLASFYAPDAGNADERWYDTGRLLLILAMMEAATSMTFSKPYE
jgi:hypothetical protein